MISSFSADERQLLILAAWFFSTLVVSAVAAHFIVTRRK